MKTFVIGRKNWMFSNIGNSARSNATLFRTIEITMANGLIPFRYLRYVLQAISENSDVIDQLLAWDVNLQ